MRPIQVLPKSLDSFLKSLSRRILPTAPSTSIFKYGGRHIVMGRSSWRYLVPEALLIYISVARIATLEYFSTVNSSFRPIQPMSGLTTKKPLSSRFFTGVQRGKLVVGSRFNLTVPQGLNMLDSEYTWSGGSYSIWYHVEKQNYPSDCCPLYDPAHQGLLGFFGLCLPYSRSSINTQVMLGMSGKPPS